MPHCHNRSHERLWPQVAAREVDLVGANPDSDLGGDSHWRQRLITGKLHAMQMANSSLSADIQRASIERDIMQRDAAEDAFP